MVANSLHLQYEELDALRELQAGFCELDVDHPLWAELAELHLVERRSVRFPYWSLTMRGRIYETDVGSARRDEQRVDRLTFPWYDSVMSPAPISGPGDTANTALEDAAPARREAFAAAPRGARRPALGRTGITLGCVAGGGATATFLALANPASPLAAIVEIIGGLTAGWIASDAAKAYARSRHYR